MRKIPNHTIMGEKAHRFQKMQKTTTAKRLITPVSTWKSMLPEVKKRDQRNNPWLIVNASSRVSSQHSFRLKMSCDDVIVTNLNFTNYHILCVRDSLPTET